MNSPQRSNGVEVADVFRQYGAAYRKVYPLPVRMLKAMSNIESCRTAALGGHVDECDACGYLSISYNSCRNRHCPKCQGLAKEKWLRARQNELLPVPYFHMVFTIPDRLHALTLINQRVVYDILFRSAAESLLQVAKDRKHLGAETGLIAVLHTWGQNLMDHPHLHCIVPGGGLSEDGHQWVGSRDDFFLPVKVLSRLFRGKFLFYLQRAYHQGELKCIGNAKGLRHPRAFRRLVDELYQKEWVVYAKESFGGPEQVLEYLGRYTHRVAISNNRILNLEDGKVTFQWKDYRDGNHTKLMTVDAFEFIRRFLLHILPEGFYKIRYYGILSNRNRRTKLRRCKEILGVATSLESQAAEPLSWEELLLELTGIDPRICPRCHQGQLRTKEVLQPISHAPP